MADKFSKVKPTSVIIWGGIWGILDLAGGWGGWRASEPSPASPTSSIPGGGAKLEGAGSSGDGWREAQCPIRGGASGMPEVCPDCGRCWGAGRVNRLIGNFAGAVGFLYGLDSGASRNDGWGIRNGGECDRTP